jgi:plasmid maintenance system antidote protein VapI
MSLAEDLRERLIYKGQTVTNVAEKLGYGRPAVSNALNGKATISVEMALRIEGVFDLNADNILHRQLNEQITEARKEQSDG